MDSDANAFRLQEPQQCFPHKQVQQRRQRAALAHTGLKFSALRDETIHADPGTGVGQQCTDPGGELLPHAHS
jgi:hypothetical protein